MMKHGTLAESAALACVATCPALLGVAFLAMKHSVSLVSNSSKLHGDE
jgi:hypothetical protein